MKQFQNAITRKIYNHVDVIIYDKITVDIWEYLNTYLWLMVNNNVCDLRHDIMVQIHLGKK